MQMTIRSIDQVICDATHSHFYYHPATLSHTISTQWNGMNILLCASFTPNQLSLGQWLVSGVCWLFIIIERKVNPCAVFTELSSWIRIQLALLIIMNNWWMESIHRFGCVCSFNPPFYYCHPYHRWHSSSSSNRTLFSRPCTWKSAVQDVQHTASYITHSLQLNRRTNDKIECRRFR